MKQGIIVNLTRSWLLRYVTLNKFIILIFICFLIGISIGSNLSNGVYLFGNVSDFFEKYILFHSIVTFFKKFFVCLFKYVIVLLVYFLSGTSMLGVAITPFVIAWQGIAIGKFISTLYFSYGLSGIAFNAVIFIPPVAIFTVCCFFAAKLSITYSLNIARLTIHKNTTVDLHAAFKNYCYKYLIFLGVTLLCTIFEVALNKLFLNYFNFH